MTDNSALFVNIDMYGDTVELDINEIGAFENITIDSICNVIPEFCDKKNDPPRAI